MTVLTYFTHLQQPKQKCLYFQFLHEWLLKLFHIVTEEGIAPFLFNDYID